MTTPTSSCITRCGTEMAITAWTPGNVDLIASSTCRRHAHDVSGDMNKTPENRMTLPYFGWKAQHFSSAGDRNNFQR
jgi:hypothetical protein